MPDSTSSARPSGDGRRRGCPRWEARPDVRVACHPAGDRLGPDVAVALLDLSEVGARLLVSAPLPRGEELMLGLTADREGQGAALGVPAVVAWYVPAPGGGYWVGVTFPKAVPFRDLQPFIHA